MIILSVMKGWITCSSPVPQEKIVDLFSDEGSKSEKLAVDTVKHCLQEISLPENRTQVN